MIDDDNVPPEPGADELLIEDLLSVMAACGATDPGPDPIWDPAPYPPPSDGQAYT